MSITNGHLKFEKLMAGLGQCITTPLAEQQLEQTDIKLIIFNGYNEISSVLETLRLIELFLNIPPPEEIGINHSNYLTYHVHNYLQEMYILKERLKTYSVKIERIYKKALDPQTLSDISSTLMEIVSDSLNGITGHKGARNLHVHSERFKDSELNWLSSTTYIANFSDEFTVESQVAYQNAKNKWHGVVKNNNMELNKLIDTYFDVIYRIITVDNQIVLPDEYIKLSNK